ncbi:hypothetical protein [Paraburkholderia sediminicola]|uniref:hypothetical protein n=1 Tax=Paraburkholderia sediminicola TaxID=458836 RepID=UPI0038BCA5E6
MKRTLMLLAAALVALTLAACGTTQPIKLTPAQFFAIACPPVQQALTLAPTLGAAIPASVQAQLPATMKLANTTCAVGATVSTASVQQFVNTAIPAANAIAQAAPDNVLSSDQKQKIAGFALLAELVVDTATAIATNAAAAQAASSSAATPASASSAASTPLTGAPLQ